MSTIIVPIRAPEPDRCPECDRIEKTKVVCVHCGHEYEEEDGPISFGVAMGATAFASAILGLLGFLWYMISDLNNWKLGESLTYLGAGIAGFLILSGCVYLLSREADFRKGRED